MAESKKTSEKKATEQKKKTPPRKRGKKYLDSAKKIKEFKNLMLPMTEAVRQIKSISFAKFDETIELHVNVLEIGLKGEVNLPHSNGKSLRVVVANDDVISKLERNIVDFDLLVATPAMMPKLTKFAKLLGPKGLMPNPKAGTISQNPEELLKKFTGNTLRYKTESKAAIVHIPIGKKSYEDAKLIENIQAILASLNKQQVKSVYICSSMSPALQMAI